MKLHVICSLDKLWGDVELYLKIFQTMACLEIVHSMFGLVKSPWFTTFMQGTVSIVELFAAIKIFHTFLHSTPSVLLSLSSLCPPYFPPKLPLALYTINMPILLKVRHYNFQSSPVCGHYGLLWMWPHPHKLPYFWPLLALVGRWLKFPDIFSMPSIC